MIRVQSPSGIKRLDVRRDEKIANFLKKVLQNFAEFDREFIICLVINSNAIAHVTFADQHLDMSIGARFVHH